MPPKRRKIIKFHRDFVQPTNQQRKAALGPFPFEHKGNKSREQMLRLVSSVEATTIANSNLNDEKLYIATQKSETSKAIPKPVDSLDWLAQIPEEGQTFEQYVDYLTTRSTGRIRPIANKDGLDILLLPIVVATNGDGDGDSDECRPRNRRRTPSSSNNASKRSSHGNGHGEQQWPNYAPPLTPLLNYTEAFFDRKVQLLPAAQIFVNHKNDNEDSNNNTNNNSQTKSKTTTKKNQQKKKKSTNLPINAFASSVKKDRFQLYFPHEGGPVNIAGRSDLTPGSEQKRIQIQVTSLLDELSRYRYSRIDKNKEKDYCLMAITMVDLYDGPRDLFCAGMAFGGDKVAAFSFHRYHPYLKMHPGKWHDYGYVNETIGCDGYSYYDDDNQNPEGLAYHPPVINSNNKNENSGNESGSGTRSTRKRSRSTAKSNTNTNTNATISSEFLRRSSKLLSHELGHLFVLDHCIHNKCLMMGTGHLVEDFKAPSHLCGVCLRKLQWRTGFDVMRRYQLLSVAFQNMGMKEESDWVKKQYDYLSKLALGTNKV